MTKIPDSARLPKLLGVLCTATSLISLLPRIATAETWLQTAAGVTYDWNVGGNWSPASFPNAAGAVANLNIDIAGAQTIRLQQAITVGTLNFGDSNGSHAQTLESGTGTNTLTFDNSGSAAQLNVSPVVNLVTNTIAAPVSLSGDLLMTFGANTGTTNPSLTTSGAFAAGANNITLTGGSAAKTLWNITGDLTGNGTVTLSTLGATNIAGTKSFTGKFVVNRGTGTDVNGSALTVTEGSIANASEVVINGFLTSGLTQNGGTLTSGNGSGQATNPGQRITQNTLTINGGTLRLAGQALSGGAVNSLVQDNVATLRFNSGYSFVSLGATGTSSGTLLNVTTLARSAGATAYVRSNKLAGALDTTTRGAQFRAGNGASFNVGTPSGTGTSVGIIPWMVAVGANDFSSTSSYFATYAGANGIRATVDADYATDYLTPTANVAIGNTTLTGTTTVNSLRLTSFGAGNITTSGAVPQTLNVTSGGVILVNNNTAIGVAGSGAAGGTLNFGSAEGVVWSNGTNTNGIGSVITGSAGFTKAGTGTLTLSGANNYSGLTTISGGTTRVGNGTHASKLGTTGDVTVAEGATLQLSTGVEVQMPDLIFYETIIADNAIVTLQKFGLSNGKMILDTGINEIIGGLRLGDTLITAPGVYGSSSSTAPLANQYNAFFSGTGVLTIVPEPSVAIALFAGLGGLALVRRRS